MGTETKKSGIITNGLIRPIFTTKKLTTKKLHSLRVHSSSSVTAFSFVLTHINEEVHSWRFSMLQIAVGDPELRAVRKTDRVWVLGQTFVGLA